MTEVLTREAAVRHILLFLTAGPIVMMVKPEREKAMKMARDFSITAEELLLLKYEVVSKI